MKGVQLKAMYCFLENGGFIFERVGKSGKGYVKDSVSTNINTMK